MASFVLEEFLGGGVLKDMGVKFADDGWDDVPTLKVIGAADMEALDLTDAQRDALELRIHLHNRSLMKYADRMEASGIGLIDLMAMRPSDLATRFKMRKTRVATFVNTSIACGLQTSQFDLRRRTSTALSRLSEDSREVLVKGKPLCKPPPFELHKSTLSESSFGSSFGSSPPRKSNASSYFGFRPKSSPPRKSNAAGGDMGYRNSYAKLSPPRKSSAGELRSKNSSARPAPGRTSSVGELGSNGNPFAGHSPPRMSNVAEFAKLFSPAPNSNAGSEFGFNGNPFGKASPPRKSNAGELGFNGNPSGKTSPPWKSTAGNSFGKASPPRKSNAGELGSNGNPFGKASPPRRSNYSGNPFGKVSPPRKSNAGELGSNGNPFGKASPPRRSNYAGNPLGKVSPPRKSTAGELGSFGKASPPRRSNVGELGFNGNACLRDSPPRKSNVGELCAMRSSPPCTSNAAGFEPPAKLRPAHAIRPNAPRGVFSATNSANKRQLCGVVKAPSSDKVAKLSDLEGVMLRQLAPEHSFGVDSRKLKGGRRDPPFKAYNLWAEKPTLFFCIRRPGCVMCRAEAHQLFARKPIFDALGVQLVAVLLEDIDEEVWSFWPRYWAGLVVLDQNRDFFRALGGGKLMKDNLFRGFILNPIARLNWRRAVKSGIPYNTRGEGTIKGGMFIVRRGRGGVAYQFAEKNFGDWAPLDEVLRVCHSIREEGESDGY